MRESLRQTPSRRRQDRAVLDVERIRGAGPLALVSMAVAYLAISQLAADLFHPVSDGAGLAPAAGLSLGTLLVLPRRLWGWLLAGVAVAELAGDLARGYSLAVCLGWTLGNVVEPLVAATLLRWVGNRHGELTPLPRLLQFLGLAVVAGPLVGASIGTAATVLGLDKSLVQTWPKFVIGDALGVLVVTPVILAWRARSSEWHRRSPWEALAMAASALAVTALVFSDLGGTWTATMAYLLIPFFTWAALRFGMLTVSVLSMVVAFVSTYVTWAGAGPFAQVDGPRQHAVTLLQMFLVVTVSTALILAALVSDLRDGRQVEAELRHRASHDLLTGLPNRAVLAEALEAALGCSGPGEGDVALLVCDVDHFKRVNDTYGHSAGDLFLVELSRRLRESVRTEDLVARISGDEFVVLLTGADAATVEAVCDRILATVCRPVPLADGGATREVPASLSAGLALGGRGTTAAQLFGAADLALYEAKRRGRGQVARADERLLAQVRERGEVERDVSSAEMSERAVCRYQPQVEPGTGRLFGLLAHPHWQHPTWGPLGEDRFLPAVEAAGLSQELFSTVLTQALDARRGWQDALGLDPAVTLAVAAGQLADLRLAETVSRALVGADAPAGALWLEVRQGDALGETAPTTLTQLREMGVRLSVAGLGTGWSPMSLLKAHPWDLLGLQPGLVAALGQDRHAEAVVAAMISMAHALGIRAGADGVTTLEHLERLAELGCDVVRGSFVGLPSTAERALAHVDAGGRWTPEVAPGSRTARA
jgi:diguanylate cyclase (GGDEF)-like protein